MNPQTEQLFSTLKLLVANPSRLPGVSEAELAFLDSMTSPFIWEKSTEDEFSIWNLMLSEGCVRPTDLDSTFASWQNIEEWGTPTNQEENNDYEYAPTRSERKDNDWDEDIANERKSYYRQLSQVIIDNLKNIYAYNLSTSKTRHQNFEWEHSDFSVSIVVAQTPDNKWLCLAPIVPDQVSYYGHNKKNAVKEQTIIHSVELETKTSEVITTIQSILDKITPIIIYGYYDGGYKYTYQHRIVGDLAASKESAIAAALQNAGVVFIEKTTVEYARDNDNPKLSQFMNKCLRDRTRYDLSFWDIGYTYDLGQTPTGDWIGTRYQNEFEYNP